MVAHGNACKPSGKQFMHNWYTYMYMHNNLLQYYRHTQLEVKTNRILTLSLSSKYDGSSAGGFVPHRATKLLSYTFMSTALHVRSKNSVTSKERERKSKSESERKTKTERDRE